jgi:hypothetical protein
MRERGILSVSLRGPGPGGYSLALGAVRYYSYHK